MTEYDSRIKRLSDNPRIILINNYKCGFSSSNLLEHSIVSEINADDTVILFYRNIFLRAISLFVNWCITDDRYATGESWLLENLREELGRSQYARFLDHLHKNELAHAFASYAGALDQIYKRYAHALHAHTQTQVEILEYYGINRIDHFVELENSAEFVRLTNIEFPYDKNNRSNPATKQTLAQCLLNSPRWQDSFRETYAKDIEFFRNHNIDIAALSRLRIS